MMDVDIDEELREAERQYLDFLDDEVTDQGVYSALVREMIEKGRSRIVVNINDLRRRNNVRAKKLLDNGFDEHGAFQRALKNYVASINTEYAKQHEEFFVGFEGSFGSKHVTPRTLTALYLGSMICLEGIVTKCSLVRPKVVRSVHYCPATKKTLERRYTDMTSTTPFVSSSVYPTKDEENNPLETEFGLSVYKDHQTLTVQEMPEKAPAGQLPRSVDIVVDNDLVDLCKPGDRVQVLGIFRCLPGKKQGHTSGVFRTILIANHVKPLSKEVIPMFSTDDVVKIRKFANQKGADPFEILAHSLAPSIHGNEYIKKAVLCMLLGGTEKILPNGTRLRGDINVLLIGDPSTAKSQMLRYILHTAPRAITTTGRGTTGVGLTAAVTSDEETGERRLEAGAMVLADRGVVCIDEFDKMSDIDRTAIHEVMEQGRVTVAKAGIHAKLNARCSVLAAANPVYGRYDQYKTPMDNIGMQDSLLSRFDLLFIVLDQMDPENDQRISDHVLRMHQYRATNEQDGDPMPISIGADILSTDDPDCEQNKDQETPVYEKHNKLLHRGSGKKSKMVSIAFMKRYVHVAKIIKPTLTREAAECIAEEYTKLRCQDQENSDVARTTPVTARTLETLIRLSTAHAKARLSKKVTLKDAHSAIELVQYAYFHKVMEKEKKRRRKTHDSDSEDEVIESQNTSVRKRRKRGDGNETTGDPNDPYNFDSAEEDTPDVSAVGRPSQQQSTVDVSMEDSERSTTAIDEQKMNKFKKSLFAKFEVEHTQSLPTAAIVEWVNKDSQEFSKDDVDTCLSQMQDSNQVMYTDDTVFLI
ncbi:DNA replication licensing factor MCM3-like [Styela clava]